MDTVVAALRAIGEPSRLRILALLSRGELTVSELVQILGQSQPRVSRHLRLLAEAGVVEKYREGTWVFYRLGETNLVARRLADAATLSIPPDDVVARRDRRRLDTVKQARAEAASVYFESVARDWDRIRALHLSEATVEAEMRQAAGDGPFELQLDVGTGTGRMLEVFADQCRKGIGVDQSTEMLAVARARLDRAGLRHCTVRKADIYSLPWPDAAADLVTIHQVLHYLDDAALAVAEAGRVVRPGGRLLIVDFAPHGLEFLRDEHAHRRLGFADDEVRSWITAAGLEPGDARTLEPEGQGLTVKIWTGHQHRTLMAMNGDH